MNGTCEMVYVADRGGNILIFSSEFGQFSLVEKPEKFSERCTNNKSVVVFASTAMLINLLSFPCLSTLINATFSAMNEFQLKKAKMNNDCWVCRFFYHCASFQPKACMQLLEMQSQPSRRDGDGRKDFSACSSALHSRFPATNDNIIMKIIE